ncbi:MAG: hypothetical protein EBQ96_03565 [Proteobacteria bacterium]|nr:hypothetical protein [Pseudomonadota bacterium]
MTSQNAHVHSWESIGSTVLRTAVTRFLDNLINLTVIEGSQIDMGYVGRAAKLAVLKTALSAGLSPDAVLSDRDFDKIEDWAAFNRELATAIVHIRSNNEARKTGDLSIAETTHDNNRMTVRVLDAFMRANENDPILSAAEMNTAIRTALIMTSEQTRETISQLAGLLDKGQGTSLSADFRGTSMTASEIRQKIGFPQDDEGFEKLLLDNVLKVIETQQFGARRSPLKTTLASLSN